MVCAQIVDPAVFLQDLRFRIRLLQRLFGQRRFQRFLLTPGDRFVPLVCLAAPVVCYALDVLALKTYGYRFGYELLLLNGLLSFVGLWALSKKVSPFSAS